MTQWMGSVKFFGGLPAVEIEEHPRSLWQVSQKQIACPTYEILFLDTFWNHKTCKCIYLFEKHRRYSKRVFKVRTEISVFATSSWVDRKQFYLSQHVGEHLRTSHRVLHVLVHLDTGLHDILILFNPLLLREF